MPIDNASLFNCRTAVRASDSTRKTFTSRLELDDFSLVCYYAFILHSKAFKSHYHACFALLRLLVCVATPFVSRYYALVFFFFLRYYAFSLVTSPFVLHFYVVVFSLFLHLFCVSTSFDPHYYAFLRY